MSQASVCEERLLTSPRLIIDRQLARTLYEGRPFLLLEEVYNKF